MPRASILFKSKVIDTASKAFVKKIASVQVLYSKLLGYKSLLSREQHQLQLLIYRDENQTVMMKKYFSFQGILQIYCQSIMLYE